MLDQNSAGQVAAGIVAAADWRRGFAKREDGFAGAAERAGGAVALPAKGAGHVVWAVSRAGLAVGMSRAERELALELASYLKRAELAAGRARVTPRNDWLAESLGRSVRHIQATLASLESAGWLLRRYSTRNRRYDGGGIDLAPLLARLPELEAAIGAMTARRRHKGREAAETAQGAVVEDWPAAPAGTAGLSPPLAEEISSQDETASIPYKEPEPRNIPLERGSRLGREGVGPDASAKSAAPADGASEAGGGYFEPGKPARPPATREAIVAILAELDPDLRKCLVAPSTGFGDLVDFCRMLARHIGVPMPAFDEALDRRGGAYVAAAIVLGRAKIRAGEARKPVAYVRSLLQPTRPVDVWRSIYALKAKGLN